MINMSSVVDGLRRTSKGQLEYQREIGGKTLTDLFQKCTAVPALSSPHYEISQSLGCSSSFGLGYNEEEEVIQDVGDHEYSKGVPASQLDHGEKGEQDSLEKENLSLEECVDKANSSQAPPRGVSIRVQSSNSPQSQKVTSQRPCDASTSPQGVLHKSPQTCLTSSQSSGGTRVVCHQNQQIVSPNTFGGVSPKSPLVISTKTPLVVSPKSPQVESLHSPEAPTSSRKLVISGPSSPAFTEKSSAAQEDTEDSSVPYLSPVIGHIKQGIDTDGDSESRWQDTSGGEDERTEEATLDLTVSFTEKLHAVTSMETGYDNRSKELMQMKQQEFLHHQTHLDSWREEVVSVVQQHHLHDISVLHDSIERKQQSKRPEMEQVVQRVKETHQHCSRRQDARLQHVEQLSQHLQEEKAKREQALDQKLEEVRTMAGRITANKTSLVSALDQCPHKQHLTEVAEKTRQFVTRLSEQAEGLAGSLTRTGPLEDVLVKLKQFHEQTQNALDFVHNLTAEAEKKAKAAAAEAEKQKQQASAAQVPQVRQQASAAQVPQAGQSAATPQGGQASSMPQQLAAGEEGALAAVYREYENNVRLLSQMDAALDPFISDQQMKKIRFDLQRAVNTPVNTISPVSSSHLRDKLLRLRTLLKGETVEVLGKQVTAQVVPQGLNFCKNLVAKMIARKAAEQVSSNHESAFAIAAVAVGLWVEFPEVGELIMAHLQALCPYVLPVYPPRLPNQSTEEYHSTLGYKIVDGNVEQQDKFLRRMSGVLRLYAAILVVSPPQGPSQAHPHGLEHAWVWLTRSMNLQPNPDITATAIYDMLQVTGSFLLRAYRVQFVKLIYFLRKGFLPKLKDVAAGSGPVIRLETFLDTFLETIMKNHAIPEPEGYLPPRFWQS